MASASGCCGVSAGNRSAPLRRAHIRASRDQDTAADALQVARQTGKAAACFIVWMKQQNRIGRRHQRDRAVTKLRRAESFRMELAGFLQLERRLIGNGKCRAAPDHDDAVGLGERRERCAPIEQACGGETIRQSGTGVAQQRVVGPGGDNPHQRGERSDKTFGRGHAQFRSGAKRQDQFGCAGERTFRLVDEADGQGAGTARHRRRLDQIVAATGLRNAQEQLAVQIERAMILRGNVRRRRSDRDSEITLEQVLGEFRRMGRAASRAGHHQPWPACFDAFDERGDRLCE